MGLLGPAMSDPYVSEQTKIEGSGNVKVANTIIGSAISINVGSRVGGTPSPQIAQPQPFDQGLGNFSMGSRSAEEEIGTLTAGQPEASADSTSTSMETIFIYAMIAIFALQILLPPARPRPSAKLLF